MLCLVLILLTNVGDLLVDGSTTEPAELGVRILKNERDSSSKLHVTEKTCSGQSVFRLR